MRKTILVLSLLMILLLNGCANRVSTENANNTASSSGKQATKTPESNEISATASVDYIDFEAIVVDENNFEKLNAEFDGILSISALNSSTQIVLMMNNHRTDLTTFDYKELSTLDGAVAENWQLAGGGMGGHHARGVLTFPKNDNPQTLAITGLPVEDVVLIF